MLLESHTSHLYRLVAQPRIGEEPRQGQKSEEFTIEEEDELTFQAVPHPPPNPGSPTLQTERFVIFSAVSNTIKWGSKRQEKEWSE